ncbi:MAG: transcription antitermination factor NusB [Balneolaceae bacterium]|nr:transcription antitermination factor NusB [Balneolaceae bacterium]
MINRRDVRETVLKALYALLQSNDSIQHVTDTIIKKSVGSKKESRRFAERLFFLTAEHNEALDEIISAHIKNWDIHRLAMIDRLVLKIALCEFLHFEEIPTKVTINEAIEIVKKYSTAKSGNFVNGILDAALDDLSEKGEINKTGRGLIQKSVNK